MEYHSIQMLKLQNREEISAFLLAHGLNMELCLPQITDFLFNSHPLHTFNHRWSDMIFTQLSLNRFQLRI